jgi:hypothetical protein
LGKPVRLSHPTIGTVAERSATTNPGARSCGSRASLTRRDHCQPRATFSAAITTAAFIEEAGGDRVKIVGGDRSSFFSEGGEACSPNLKVCAYYQTAKHDYAHPCTDWHECFWLNWLYPVRVKSLQPNVLVPLRFEDWNAGHDAAFLVAREMAKRRY